MYVLIILVALALTAVVIVSVINRAQEQERMRRLQQRKLRVQVDALLDVVNCLEYTVPNRLIAKYVNDEAITLMNAMLVLEKGPKSHIESSIHHAQNRSAGFAEGRNTTPTSYQKGSDAQISQAQLQLDEASKVLRHICAQGRMSDDELKVYMTDLTWAHLMVSVTSFIGQGHKFMALSDRLSAHNFYQRAQQLLMESMHPDQRRLRMIKELGEIITGGRKSMSPELFSERASAM